MASEPDQADAGRDPMAWKDWEELEGWDPTATCSGCRIVAEYLEALAQYIDDMHRQGRDVTRSFASSRQVCENRHFLHFKLRRNLYGLETFVFSKKVWSTWEENTLIDMCKASFRQHGTQLLTSGHEGLGCDQYCQGMEDASMVNLLHRGWKKDPYYLIVTLLPYLLMLALSLVLVVRYLRSLRRKRRSKQKRS